jgi:HlyD family secretion protein
MRSWLNRAGLLAILIVIGAGIAWSVRPRPVPVETAAVIRGRFAATVDEDGKSRIRERYVISAPLTGLLARIRLKVGDYVEVGDVITTLTPSPSPLLDPRSRREAEERLGAAEANRERTKASLERAQAQAEQARTEYERVRTLTARGASTAQTLERAELAKRVAERDLAAAQFQHHAAEHELEQARAMLARYRDAAGAQTEQWSIAAAVAGLVLKLSQESETVVQPGTPLVEIGDPRDLEIVVDVLTSDAVEIQPGAEVAIEHWGGALPLVGHVRLVEPIAFTKISTLGVEEQRVNVVIDLDSPSEMWAGLGDGFRVDAKITVFSQEDAIIVPAGALFRIGQGWNAYVVHKGRAQLRPVDLSRQSGRSAAIKSGLAPGERIIVYPSERVAKGVRVEPE